MKKAAIRPILYTVLFVVLLILLNKDVSIPYGNKNDNQNIKYERAKVTGIIGESLSKESEFNGVYRGVQELEIKILTGSRKGETHSVKNYLSNLHSIYAVENTQVIVSVDTSSAEVFLISIYNYYIAPVIYALMLLFLGVLWLVGGKKGLASAIGLIFTFVCIMFLFLPMLFKGFSPIISSVILVVLTTFVTLYLLNGWSSKTISALIGTTAGVVIAGVVSAVFGAMSKLTFLNTQEAETLILVFRQSNLKVEGLLFAAILIASLGAIMDMSLSIASSVYEIYVMNKCDVSRGELFISGLNVGRDMMGTMTNTLILAFTGASLNLLIIIYATNVQYNQLINTNMVIIEIIQGLAGSVGIILTVPIIAYVSSRLIPLLHKRSDKSSESTSL